MACSFVKNSSLLASSVASALSRRGYSSASMAAAVKQAEKKNVIMGLKDGGAAESSWVPDPVTGYYRPSNLVKDVDSADLRELLLNNRKSQHN